MIDCLVGFSPDEVRQPTTEREKRVAEAAKLAGIDAYNFFESGEQVAYNQRKPDASGEVWVSRYVVSNRTIDIVSRARLAEILAYDWDAAGVALKAEQPGKRGTGMG